MKLGNCPSTSLSYSQQKNITNAAAVYCGDTPLHVTPTTTNLESTKNKDVSLYQMPSSSLVLHSSKLSSADTIYSSSNNASIIGSFFGGAAVFGGLSIICIIILFRFVKGYFINETYYYYRYLYKAKKIKTQDKEVIEMEPNVVYGEIQDNEVIEMEPNVVYGEIQDNEVIEMEPNIVYGIHDHSMMITENNSTSDHNKDDTNIYDEPFQ